MAQTEAGFVIPPPPPDRGRARRITAVVASVGFGGLAVVASPDMMALLGGLSGACGALGYLLHVARKREIGAALATAALDRTARGRFDEARALLAAVSPKVLSSQVGMMVDSQRAALALYKGDLESAVAEATKGAREHKRLYANARIHQGSALSIRCMALAGLGRKEEALADVAKLRNATYRQGTFVARAAVAEALLFARDKDFDSLAKLIREERTLLFGATGPRERMIARALARMVAAKKVSIYREPAKREEHEVDEHASWVARIAPEAASYAAAPKLGARGDAPESIAPDAIAHARKAAPKAKSRVTIVLGLWVALILLFLSIWQFLTPTPTAEPQVLVPGTDPAGQAGTSASTLVLALALAVVFVAVRVLRARKLFVQLSSAMEQRLRGRHDEARAAFERLATNKALLVAPQAYRELAVIASSAGDFGTARRHAEAGIDATRRSAASLAHSRPLLLPMLQGELAFALAAAGNVDSAEQELENICALSPSYAHLARDTFRVRLLRLTVARRFDEAAAMARERPADLFLSLQEELLCDALRLRAGDPLPEGERERIELDLRDDVMSGRFLDAVAPTLRASLPERRGPRLAVAAEPTTTGEEVVEELVEAKQMRLDAPT